MALTAINAPKMLPSRTADDVHEMRHDCTPPRGQCRVLFDSEPPFERSNLGVNGKP